MIHVCMLVTNRAFDDPRVCMEAGALASAGCRVTVVGWDREIDTDVRLDRNGVSFVRLHLRSTHGRGAAQALYLGRFWMRAIALLRSLRPDVVHCHDLDTFWPGRRAAVACGARLVFDAHENFPDMMVGHLPAPMVRALRLHERRLVPRADLLITVGRRLCEHYRLLGARHATVVGNWKDAREYQFPPAQVHALRKQLGLEGRIVVAFIANLGRERHLEPLLHAVAGDARFACVIGGKGCLAPLAEDFAERHANVHYLGAVPPHRVGLLTAACDAIYYGFDTGNPNSKWSAPNKLYEAIAAAKPIIAGDFGEVGPTVRQGGCGILADTSTPAGMREALEQLAAPHAAERLSRCARLLQERYSARAAREALLNAYHRLLWSRFPEFPACGEGSPGAKRAPLVQEAA